MRKHLYSLIWYNDPTASNDLDDLGSILSILKSNDFDKLYLFRPYEVSGLSIYKIKEARLKEVIKERYGAQVEIHDLPKEKENRIGDWKDIFYNSLNMCLNKENNDDILWYVNFSSGTPIMISALTYALISLKQPIISIYVNEEKMNNVIKYDVSKKTISAKIDASLNTTTIASILPLQTDSLVKSVKQLLNTYDYGAVEVIVSALNNNDLVKMCQGAIALMNLDIKQARESFSFTPLMPLLKNKIPENVLSLLIYINNLQIKIDQNEYFDFVMRTSPLLYEICFFILIEYKHFPKELIKKSDSYKTDIVNRKDLNNIPLEYRRYFENYFRNTPGNEPLVFNTSHLLNLISYQLTNNLSMVSELNELRDFEWKIRNEFAHVFSLYTNEYIYSKTNKNPQDIITLYNSIMQKTAYNYAIDEHLFNIYQYINESICELLAIIVEE